MEITISTDVVDKLSVKLKDISVNTMSKIGQTIKSDILLNFIDEKAPDGTDWADLKPSTIKAKIRKSGKVVKLQDTGNLKKSLNYEALVNKVQVGYGIEYSVFHQLGTKNMVARKILPTESSEIDIEEIERLILKDLTSV